MDRQDVLNQTVKYVQDTLEGDASGHEWWHVYRVWQLAKTIGAKEQADMFVVELGALLHDIADWKFHDGDIEIGPRKTTDWLTKLGLEQSIVEQVAYIVRHISYRGGTNTHVMETLEGKIVQDADRLDALGAIGIARTFAFGGAHGRAMYDPDHKPQDFDSFDEFRKNIKTGTTINHFYEKLLRLKDGMHTEAAKQIAEDRHTYMEGFLNEFYGEWDGKR